MINVGLRRDIYSARICSNTEIEAKDFIQYTNREDVENTILDIFRPNEDYGNIYVYESEIELDIPDEFWEEWEQLKKTNIGKFRDYIAQYIETTNSPVGNHINYPCSQNEFRDIIKHLCNISCVEVQEVRLNIGGNIIKFKVYDKRETETNID